MTMNKAPRLKGPAPIFPYSVDNEDLFKMAEVYWDVFEDFYKSLNKEQVKSIQYYKETGYLHINTLLRTKMITKILINQLSEIRRRRRSKTETIPANNISDIVNNSVWRSLKRQLKHVQNIDDAFYKSASISNNISLPLLFRGVNETKQIYNSWEIGEEMRIPTYLSTSMSPTVAWKFQTCGNRPCCMFVLRIPKRKMIPWLYLNYTVERGPFRGPMDLMDEHEILLPRNTVWKLVKKYETSISPNSGLWCSYSEIKKTQKPENMVTVFECEFISYSFGSLHFPDDTKKTVFKNLEVNLHNPIMLEEDM